ncbi:PR domain zinc finger protein 13 [Porphyridium purpureum]|uniref:PR domain zinc finger protein 13 n=1 Tax=Porphyridium purpureum TaxID=35688 RepID=A0A5J4YNG9_PORPP|nr:PR domain zinc finger protein 13 [Porphyridium purpureum]|eukprot:POR9197..scf244_11
MREERAQPHLQQNGEEYQGQHRIPLNRANVLEQPQPLHQRQQQPQRQGQGQSQARNPQRQKQQQQQHEDREQASSSLTHRSDFAENSESTSEAPPENTHRGGRMAPYSKLPRLRSKLVAEQGSSLACRMCRKPFRRRSNLNKHIRNHHENLKSYRCNLCPLMFKQKSGVVKHLNMKHDVFIGSSSAGSTAGE